MKVIPVYLPQFHRIPENDAWWGEGFTEWVNVRNAEPLFEGHNQPRVPLDNNYYDLSDIETLKWQCKLAKDHEYMFLYVSLLVSTDNCYSLNYGDAAAHPGDRYQLLHIVGKTAVAGYLKESDRESKVLIYDDFNNEQGWIDHFNYLMPFF
jgi:hypothetical protein